MQQDSVELYDAAFIDRDQKVITIGKAKDPNVFDKQTNDFQVVSGIVRIYEILSIEPVLQLRAHKEDVLGMKVVTIDDTNYVVTCGVDGLIMQWTLNASFRYSYHPHYTHVKQFSAWTESDQSFRIRPCSLN